MTFIYWLIAIFGLFVYRALLFMLMDVFPFLGYFAVYFILCIALQQMAEKRNLSITPWVFIPFIHSYTLGKLAGPIQIGKYKLKNINNYYLTVQILVVFLFFLLKIPINHNLKVGEYFRILPLLFMLLSFFMLGLRLLILYTLYSSYEKEYALFFTILSIPWWSYSFLLYHIRKNDFYYRKENSEALIGVDGD